MKNFRVIGIDKFNPPGEDQWIIGEYDSLKEAFNVALKRTLSASGYASDPTIAEVYYVYDENGNYVAGNIFPGFLKIFFLDNKRNIAIAENATIVSMTAYDDRNNLAYQRTFHFGSASFLSKILDFFSETGEMAPPDQATRVRETEYDIDQNKVGEEWFNFKLSCSENDSDSGVYRAPKMKFDEYNKSDSLAPIGIRKIIFQGPIEKNYTYSPDKAIETNIL